MDDQVQQIVNTIKEDGKINDNEDKRFTTKELYFKMGNDICGIPKQQITAVSDFNNKLCDAAIRVATDDLADRIKDAKSNGNDPKDLKSEVRMPIHGGRLSAEVFAERRHNNPRDPEHKIINRGSSKIALRMNDAITKTAAAHAKDTISGLLD